MVSGSCWLKSKSQLSSCIHTPSLLYFMQPREPSCSSWRPPMLFPLHEHHAPPLYHLSDFSLEVTSPKKTSLILPLSH